MNPRFIVQTACFCTLLPFGLALGGAAPRPGVDLAEAILAEAGVSVMDCPPEIRELAGGRHEPRCGAGPEKFGAFKKKLEPILAGREATDWDKDDRFMRRAYWLGAGSIEVVYDRRSHGVGLLVSPSYPRCGDDLPFTPPGFSGSGNAPPSLQLAPLSYPPRAERGKVDGTVGLAVDFDAEGRPSVRCIHHGSPAGYGFEFHAIEAIRRWNETMLETDHGPPASPTNVLVLFSRASSRRRGTAASYH